MSDFLLELGKNSQARRIFRTLRLPIPLPESLERRSSPWEAQPLLGKTVAVGMAGGELTGALAEALVSAGATPVLAPLALRSAFVGPSQAFGGAVQRLDAMDPMTRFHGVVFDASGLEDVAGLRALYELFTPLAARVSRSGRVVILGRASPRAPAAAMAQAALDGFTRSLAKELGKTGVTANLVLVTEGAEGRLGPVVRFLLSPRAAFVSAQPITITTTARAIVEPSMVRPLEKKVALVTGAARGIGNTTARLLAQEGARVICLDRPADGDALRELADAIGGTALQVDLGDAEAPPRIAAAVEAGGGVDVVVHNAGITRDKTVARMKPEHWDPVLDVNLGAVLRVTDALLPHLRDEGRIVCLSSIAGLAGNVGQAAYATSKAGLVGWVRATAQELAGRGITVNAVAPGFIETRLTAAIPMAVRQVARRLSALGQGGLPEDVAQTIVFLASPGAQGLTGSTLRVCGGAFIGA